MNNKQNNINSQSENTVSYAQDTLSYGYTSSSIEIAEPLPIKSTALTFNSQISFFFSEYFKGMLFIILTSVFIVAIPKLLTQQGIRKLAIYNFLKRTLDIFGSLLGLILTLPVWIIVPILIKLDSPGSIFYSQIRVGQNRRQRERRAYQDADAEENRKTDRRGENNFGRQFKVYKFRTMVSDAEGKTGPVWATKNDSRITKLGAFLRKSRLDEIPQFVNVLKGEMALVGPRPERPKFVRQLSEEVADYTKRLEVKPGITGLAQVTSGYDDSISAVRTKVELDLKYINNRSIWMEIKILFRTVLVVFTGKGAH